MATLEDMGSDLPNELLRGKRIAVVEDEPPIGMILGIMLDELGCVQAGSANPLAGMDKL